MDLQPLSPGLYGSCYGFGLITIEALKMLNTWCFMQEHTQLQKRMSAIFQCCLSVCIPACFSSEFSLEVGHHFVFNARVYLFNEDTDDENLNSSIGCGYINTIQFLLIHSVSCLSVQLFVQRKHLSLVCVCVHMCSNLLRALLCAILI